MGLHGIALHWIAGLLDRPVEERNEMEKLTFASMEFLPTAVIFVIDPTGLSGEKSTLRAQLNVRAHLKQRFPRRPWLDVVSKADIELSPEVQKLLPEGYLPVSVLPIATTVTTAATPGSGADTKAGTKAGAAAATGSSKGINMDLLKQRVEDMLLGLRALALSGDAGAMSAAPSVDSAHLGIENGTPVGAGAGAGGSISGLHLKEDVTATLDIIDR
jgi:hypothetical protein